MPVRLFGFLYRRHLVGLTFNALVRTAFGLPYRDTQCGLKAFRRGALERLGRSLTIDGFAIDVEILLVARALGLRVTEVPVVVTYESAASSVRLIRSAAAMSSDLLRMLMRRVTGRYRPAGSQPAAPCRRRQRQTHHRRQRPATSPLGAKVNEYLPVAVAGMVT